MAATESDTPWGVGLTLVNAGYFFARDHNFYRFQNNFLQHKVSRPSLIDFQGVALSALPWVFDPPSDLGFIRVK